RRPPPAWHPAGLGHGHRPFRRGADRGAGMSAGFDPGWLALRAPFDAAARSPQALAPLRRWAAGRGGAVLRIADLGGGTGANLRFLAPLLPMPQHWTVIDSDPALLGRIDLAALPVPATRLRCDL